jgi:hypothetical protein
MTGKCHYAQFFSIEMASPTDCLGTTILLILASHIAGVIDRCTPLYPGIG